MNRKEDNNHKNKLLGKTQMVAVSVKLIMLNKNVHSSRHPYNTRVNVCAC